MDASSRVWVSQKKNIPLLFSDSESWNLNIPKQKHPLMCFLCSVDSYVYEHCRISSSFVWWSKPSSQPGTDWHME